MESAEKAKQMIREITVEVELGKIYTGKVVRIEEYGAFVEILPNIVGLLHISEVAPYRVKNIKDEINLGDTITVKVIDIDEDNKRIRLSKKALEETEPRPESGERSDRTRSHSFKRRPYGSSNSRSRGGRNRF